MQKEELLNSLSRDGREALEQAKQLALLRGGVLSPLHLLIATLEYLCASTISSSSAQTRFLQACHESLAERFPLQGLSITITRDTQAVIVAAIELAKQDNRSQASPLHLLRASLAQAMVKEALPQSAEHQTALAELQQKLHTDFSTNAQAVIAPATPQQAQANAVSSTENLPPSPARPKVTPPLQGALAEFCADLAEESIASASHQFVGREREMTAVLETLCRKLKNNPLLIGKPGVGKTALVAAVASRLCEGNVPQRLRGKRVLEVSRLRLLADAKFAGDLEERLKNLLEEVRRAGDVILFFDEIHTLLNAGGAGGTGDIANLLKSSLSKGEITCIGATTLAEYYKYIARDEALARRFSTITIEEPSPDETRRILMQSRSAFEQYHSINIGDEAIALIVDLADRYLHFRSFPDKAFDLMDKAAAKATIAGYETLSRECVTETLSEITGLPLEIMDEDPAERLQRLEDFLNAAVPGQARAARDIARVVRIAKLHLELRPERPDGVFLFVGVEGAGKHEMASALAKFLYGASQKMLDFDMNQFSESHSLSRLIGAEPGYVGFGERSGLLAKAAEDHPHSVLYFRNLDLAHPVIQQFLGEAFELGRFTDANGARIALSNTTIIVALSQIGEHGKHAPVGFFANTEDHDERRITGNLKLTGSLKLRERGSGYNLVESLVTAIDEVIEFQVLDREATEKIIAERLESLRGRLESAQPVTVKIDAALVAYFTDKLTAERKSLAQLERWWKETIVIPFTNLQTGKRNHGAKTLVTISIENHEVKVAATNAPDSLAG
ncbi:MAG: ATP-dependent Clp protease ATP-binding subunit [Acidobacteria bacterium]|nr:ATP-dependent Clp protease ATP-binding subunit [Acidobacteriota bacterium]